MSNFNRYISDVINWWTLNDTPNANIGANATWTGTPTYEAVKFGNGATIDSATPSTQHLTASDSSTFDPNDFAIGIQIKSNWAITNGITNSGVTQIGYWGWRFNDTNWMVIDSFNNANATRLVLDIGGGFTIYTITTGYTWSADSVNHILFAYKRTGIDGGSTNALVYLNGTQVFTSTTAGGNQANTGGVHYLGTFKTSAIGGGFDGGVDNIKIYKNISSDLITSILNNRNNEGFPRDYTGVI